MTVTVVIPTIGRPSLDRLFDSLAASAGDRPEEIIVVDDRPGPPQPVAEHLPGWTAGLTRVIRSGGRGPAAARNVGRRFAPSECVGVLGADGEGFCRVAR